MFILVMISLQIFIQIMHLSVLVDQVVRMQINSIIKYIKPQGSVMLMGVSENKVAINTRDILEKGLTLIGCSRSGRKDFIEAVKNA